MTRMRGSLSSSVGSPLLVPAPSNFTARLDAAAAALPFVVSPSHDAAVGTLLELHYYFHISKNHDDPKSRNRPLPPSCTGTMHDVRTYWPSYMCTDWTKKNIRASVRSDLRTPGRSIPVEQQKERCCLQLGLMY